VASRAGEELPAAALDWLRAAVPGLAGEPEITQYSGGASNWTYRLRFPARDLVLRRPPAGTKARSAHDMAREYRIQQALRPVFPLVPEMVAHCTDTSVIGAEFYVMERVDGLIPRRDFPRGHTPAPALARRLSESAVDTLVSLHQVDAAAAGLADIGRGAGYVKRQVDGWSDRYVKARTWNVPRLRRVRDWLRANAPDDVAACVIHNDFRLDNLVLDPEDPARVRAVLDWEMATIGDPLMDLGGALAYWVQADDDAFLRSVRRQPTHLPGMLTRAEVVERYCARTGRRADGWRFYEAFGLFRLAAIAQQIYYRYHRRETRNPAFRHFWLFVTYLGWRAGRVIARAEARRRS
jgi:aminoglycoside phosphotransferase (APT) family kinase protein